MNKLKNKFQLKIKLPIKKVEINESHSVSQQSSNITEVDNKNSISQITENIYVSGYLIAKDISFLIKNNFTHLINCACGSSMEYDNQEEENKMNNKNNSNLNSQEFSKIKKLSIFLRDDANADILSNILEVINFIEKENNTYNNVQNKEKKILFHCIEGKSRAPALIAGYLIWKNNFKAKEVIDLIISKRKCVDINLGFIIQLYKWENYLHASSETIKMFKLIPSIILLEESDIEKENILEGEYLIKIKKMLIHLKHFNIINNNSKDKENDIDKVKKISEFIENIKIYDKPLINNKQISLITIDVNTLNINCFKTKELFIEEIKKLSESNKNSSFI